ncbi:putative pentatricopeptide repeat-containing protein At3g15130 isoform X2 [Prunus avium]|uniref:Pentatricopeptide repeat-containing protein At3g15130 isoform X2 n=1 Tax=Prunus avium TaxID=42229 RepID=A0A6P5SZW5_PRUAV|nr:putative pentatricopeptide repeat-containing protein At3g15130 isoform X2 [Prunus avium]
MNERQRLANLLRNCSKNLLLDQGMQAHGTVMKMGLGFDLMLSNDLIDMYGKCGRTGMACAVFDRMPERNVVSWTALMCGYLQNGNAKGSLSLFSKMGLSEIKPNEFTFSINLKASGFVGIAENGMQIHNMCTKSGFEWVTVVSNSILDMYTKCGRVSEAARMFNVMPVKNLITWNAMIAGYTLKGNGERALLLFRQMQGMGEVPDEYTITSTLKACSGLGAIRQGSQIHSSLITRGFLCSVRTMIAGALVDLYVKCSHLTEAQRIFDQIEQKNLVSWSALILGYAQECNLLQAMDLFRQLRVSIHHQVDGFILSSLMGVFADFALVEQDEAEKLFNETPVRNVISWTIMITGYGKHGLGRKSIRLFHQMQSEDIEPDGVTYLAVLSACSHSGLVEECQEYFSRLCHDRWIERNVEHYACMVDLLGRAGRLKEAKNLIDSMPLKPNVGILQTLLSACKVHGDLEIGREVGETLLRLDGGNPVNYVMLSNIYAEAGYWKECERLRKLFKMKGLKKEAGRSWVEIDKEVHFFYNRDETHPLTEKIHQKLKEMEQRIKSEIGYVHGVRFALHDVEEESKEESLRVHSEKLAIGLALVCGEVEKGHKTIRVFKNLRVCGDCHVFIKGLSKVLKVVFLVRDANRFHKFENGLCSCGDYW